ncbi:MAG: LptA/OstA family protein [Candidatus Margulisiibacteriota bacterium]
MEESSSWKVIILAALFSLGVLGVAYFLISPRDTTFFNDTKLEKIAEFRQTRIEGRREGKRLWELKVGYAWTDKAQEVTTLQGITAGRIYDKEGHPVLANLAAPRGLTFRHSEIVEAFDARTRLDLGRVGRSNPNKSKWVSIRADHIKFVPAEKKSWLDGHVVLTERNGVIRAGNMAIDHEKKSALLTSGVKIDRRDGLINADSLEYLGEAEQMTATGQVDMSLKESAQKTRIKCRQATFYLDIDRDLNLAGSLEVAQGKKLSAADAGTYSRRQKRLALSGRTKTILEKAEAALRTGSLTRLNSPDKQAILKGKTVVLANEIFFATKTGDARATGSVEVQQQGRTARSETAFYDERQELLTLSGNVFMKRGEEWIACRKVVVSVGRETFEALGVTEAKFKL